MLGVRQERPRENGTERLVLAALGDDVRTGDLPAIPGVGSVAEG